MCDEDEERSSDRSRPRSVRDEHARDAGGDAFGVAEMEELVRPVRVRLGTENPRDHELSVGKELAQQGDDGDAAALALGAEVLSEEILGGRPKRHIEPRSERRAVPASRALVDLDLHPHSVGRVHEENVTHGLSGDLGRERRRDAQRAPEGELGGEGVAGVLERRQAIHARDRERRPPGASMQSIVAVLTHRLNARQQTELLVHLVAEHLCRVCDLHQAVIGRGDDEVTAQDASRLGVLDAGEEHRCEPEEIRHDAARATGVDGVFHDLELQIEADQATKRGRQPDPLVVPAA